MNSSIIQKWLMRGCVAGCLVGAMMLPAQAGTFSLEVSSGSYGESGVSMSAGLHDLLPVIQVIKVAQPHEVWVRRDVHRHDRRRVYRAPPPPHRPYKAYPHRR